MDFKKILTNLNQQQLIGALEITDLDLKYIQIDGQNTILKSLKLESDIIKDGKIQDENKFIESLNKFHSEITGGRNKKVYAIINIPDNNVYVQMFNLPQIASANFEEAAQLNLKMISPIDFENAYEDWQIVDEKNNQFEILAAFIQKQIIDKFEELFKKSGFIPVAFEFPGLSLSRLAVNLGADFEIKKSYIILHIGSNGLSFNLVKNNNLYFNHFVSWQSVYEDKRVVAFESFKELVIAEIKKVISFYNNHWGGQIDEFILITHGLEDDILKIISQNFSFKIKKLSLKKYKETAPIWYIALGSALRGEINRSKDNFISLASVGTEKEFKEQRKINFIKTWRNIFITTIAIVLIINVGADWFLTQTISNLESQKTATISQSSNAELNKLESTAVDINKKIDLSLKAYSQRSKWGAFLDKLKNLDTADIKITRIYIQSISDPIVINASAPSDSSALNFKNILENNPQFSNVDLPLSRITQDQNGVNFVVTFKIKSL